MDNPFLKNTSETLLKQVKTNFPPTDSPGKLSCRLALEQCGWRPNLLRIVLIRHEHNLNYVVCSLSGTSETIRIAQLR